METRQSRKLRKGRRKKSEVEWKKKKTAFGLGVTRTHHPDCGRGVQFYLLQCLMQRVISLRAVVLILGCRRPLGVWEIFFYRAIVGKLNWFVILFHTEFSFWTVAVKMWRRDNKSCQQQGAVQKKKLGTTALREQNLTTRLRLFAWIKQLLVPSWWRFQLFDFFYAKIRFFFRALRLRSQVTPMTLCFSLHLQASWLQPFLLWTFPSRLLFAAAVEMLHKVPSPLRLWLFRAGKKVAEFNSRQT